MAPARHFVEQAVELILERFPGERVYTCESGVTPSGKIHLGNFFDMCIADAVRRMLEEKGVEARHIIAIDSRDPFRRPPEFAPEDFKREAGEYVGLPFEEVPDPWGCHRSFADHFVDPLRTHLEDYGIVAEIKTAREIHRSEEYIKLLLEIIRRREEVRELLNEVRRRAGHQKLYPEGWIPFRPQCARCHRIDELVEPVELIGDDRVRYVCKHCGHEGVASIREAEGKPPWRIDWPLRWLVFGVHFEPLGKDHMASGSSYDTARVLVRELFGRQPPVPVFYDFVLMKVGDRVEKFSKRKGIGLGIDEWLRYAPPEVLRFMILRREAADIEREALQHWVFDPKQIPSYVDEYDKLEEAYFNLEAQPPRLRGRIAVTYRLSQVGPVPARRPRRVPYMTAVVVSQRARDEEEGLEILRRLGVLPEDADEAELEDARRRLRMARNWVEDFAPEYKFVSPELPEEALKLSDQQLEALRLLKLAVEEGRATAENLREVVWEIAEKVYGSRRKAIEVYRAAYVALSGKPYGPPLAKLIFELAGRELFCRRVEELLRRAGAQAS